MRWIESDLVQLNQNHHLAHEEANKALKERFPNAMKWFIGFRSPGVIHGEQISAIIEGKEVEEVEEWQADYEEVREMVSFLIRNWTEAGRVHAFGYEEWSTIWQALRYCAEKIGHISETKKIDALREKASVLSGRLVAEAYVHSGTEEDLDLGELPIYHHDWMTILRACQYTYKNIPTDNPKMAELKENLEKLTPDILHRIKYHENNTLKSNGLKEIEIHRRLNEIEIEPWNFADNIEKTQERYRELRRMQGDDTQFPNDCLHVLRFCVNEGAKIDVYDWLGNFKESHIAEPEEFISFRGCDLEYQVKSDFFVFGRDRADRVIVSTDDVTIKESEISYILEQEQKSEHMDYIYTNFKVEKYKSKV
jgi:hypothetical protein